MGKHEPRPHRRTVQDMTGIRPVRRGGRHRAGGKHRKPPQPRVRPALDILSTLTGLAIAVAGATVGSALGLW